VECEIKDVDIFIPEDADAKDESDGTYDCRIVDKFEDEGTTFEILARTFSTVDELLAGFDVGICQIAFNPMDKKWTILDNFIHDWACKRLTVRKKTAHWEEHLLRLKEKFPDWEVYVSVEEVV
jgi:hypothetical protein